MTAEHAAIARAFEPDDLEPLLRAAGVTRTVLVQSAATDEDTDYMFDLASDVSWVGGIVAWCRLDDERARTRRVWTSSSRRPKLRGIRHLIHQEPDPHWILQPAVAARALAARGGRTHPRAARRSSPTTSATFPSSPGATPGSRWSSTTSAKPPLGTAQMEPWGDLLRAAAEQPNVYAKVSGPEHRCARRRVWSAADLEPAVRVAVDAFGPERLVCGSDWPVALLNGDYVQVWRETTAAIEHVAGPHAAAEIMTATPTSSTVSTMKRLERPRL